MSRLRERYEKEVAPALKKEFGYRNVMLLDPDTNEPTRIGSKKQADGTRVRIGRKSGAVVDK